MIYGLVASFKAEKRKVSVGDAWFRVPPSLSINLSLSLSLSLSLRVGVLVCGSVCLLLVAVEKFVFYIVFLFQSDQIGFSLGVFCEGHGLAEKLLLIIFIF